ncbi:hypothetical protein U1Q18_003430, partial [Sarracenia purpurea var. burkii]
MEHQGWVGGVRATSERAHGLVQGGVALVHSGEAHMGLDWWCRAGRMGLRDGVLALLALVHMCALVRRSEARVGLDRRAG